MKIIKRGNLKLKTYRKTCPKCGCIFEFLENEICVHYGTGDMEWHYIYCPMSDCKQKIDVSDYDLKNS